MSAPMPMHAKPSLPAALPMTRPIVVMLALLLSGALTFSNLAFAPLNDWDEAWHARVALDIARTNSFFTYTDAGELHYALASAKPPLYLWMMAVSIKLAGPTEFAVRLMPALCHLLTVAAVTAFCWTRLNWTVALTAALLLGTNDVHVYHHGARTGDIDAPLVLFLTLTMIGAYRLAERRWTWWLPVAWAAALLTKGTAALQIVPVVALFLVWQRAWRGLAWAVASFVLGMLPAAAFILVREHWQPGIAALLAEEIDARFTTTVGGGDYRPLRYVMVTAQALLPAILGLLIIWAATRGRFHLRSQAASEAETPALLKWLVLWWVVPTVLFSLAVTQHGWYIAPALVPACVLAAWLLRAGLSRLEQGGRRHVGPLVALVVVGGTLGPAVWKSFVTDTADLRRRSEFDQLVAAVSRDGVPRPIIDYALMPAERFYLARTELPVRRVESLRALRGALAESPAATLVYDDTLAPVLAPLLADREVQTLVHLPRRGTTAVMVTAKAGRGS